MINIYALTTLQLIFIIIASVVAVLIIFLFIALPIMKIKHKKQFKKYYHKKIYKVALYNDYYLINNFVFKMDQKHDTYVDHILFGDKFIFVIMDKYYDGNLVGNFIDPDLVLISRNGSKSYVANPYVGFNRLLSRFSTETGIKTEYMIGVTVINNDCRVNIETPSKQFFMIQRNKIAKFVKTVESRDVGVMNQDQLQEAVLAVNNLNLNKEK